MPKDRIPLPERILSYLQKWHEYDPNVWINGGEIERLALAAEYKASTASRRLREMEDAGLIERRLNKKGHVEYRIPTYEDLKQKYPALYVSTSEQVVEQSQESNVQRQLI